MRATLGKDERLKRKKVITSLFETGTKIYSKPLVLIYQKTELPTEHPVQIGVSIPKRNVRKAVDRNRLKRLVREAYRLNKSDLYRLLEERDEQYAVFFVYTGPRKTEFKDIEERIIELISRFTENVSKAHNDEADYVENE